MSARGRRGRAGGPVAHPLALGRRSAGHTGTDGAKWPGEGSTRGGVGEAPACKGSAQAAPAEAVLCWLVEKGGGSEVGCVGWGTVHVGFHCEHGGEAR